ncbi:MAG TPA: hypothetical protein VM597_30340, partial [Gemmataceae bacterium]|nr:hypothetical protein [Gemmataceae bacterium]
MVSSLLSGLFGSDRSRTPARKPRPFAPQLEALGDRLMPSVTFTENTATHVLTVNAASGQNNTVAVVNDGDGNLTVTADGTTRNFTGIRAVQVKTHDGADTVTYSQGTSGGERDLVRNFTLDVFLGDNAPGTTDRFTANIFGDVGYYSGGWQARNLGIMVLGEGGADRIDVNAAADTDVRTNSAFNLLLYGGGGSDNITFDQDGDVDGVLAFAAAGENDDDAVAVNLHLDAGSSGRV